MIACARSKLNIQRSGKVVYLSYGIFFEITSRWLKFGRSDSLLVSGFLMPWVEEVVSPLDNQVVESRT